MNYITHSPVGMVAATIRPTPVDPWTCGTMYLNRTFYMISAWLNTAPATTADADLQGNVW
jgi:hypothetical protein